RKKHPNRKNPPNHNSRKTFRNKPPRKSRNWTKKSANPISPNYLNGFKNASPPSRTHVKNGR
ncbi:MAG: hypothetical protein IKS67_07140, partial [Victivallales bacterium]|nr:hypothetical protein [Victivallales bacterium]